MPWVLPPLISTGNPLPASWITDVNGDLTILQTNVGLLTTGSALAGSPPATNAPNFSFNGGTFVTTTNASGGIGYNFPTPFPNGLLTVVATVGDSATNNQFVTMIAAQCSGTGFGAIVSAWNGSVVAGVNTGVVRVNWIAIGF